MPDRDPSELSIIDRIFRLLSVAGGLVMPFVLLWLTQGYRRQEQAEERQTTRIEKVDTRFDALEKRVATLESTVANVPQQVQLMMMKEALDKTTKSLEEAVAAQREQRRRGG